MDKDNFIIMIKERNDKRMKNIKDGDKIKPKNSKIKNFNF